MAVLINQVNQDRNLGYRNYTQLFLRKTALGFTLGISILIPISLSGKISLNKIGKHILREI